MVQGRTSGCSCVYGNKCSDSKKDSEFTDSPTGFPKMILSHLVRVSVAAAVGGQEKEVAWEREPLIVMGVFSKRI